MWEFSIFRALGLMVRTWPFVLLRALVYLAIAVALVVAAGAGAWIGTVLAGLWMQPNSAFAGLWGGALGLALGVLVVALLRGRLLYRVTTRHLAVMVEALDGRPLPLGTGQIARGRAIVADRFGDAPSLRALDKLVRGVIRTATGLVDGLLVDI
ncbi:MAG: hypothetical protein V4630_13950, partial [Pseudomonadota bacterium]